jgi:CheY-like chemotaxis protein
VPHAILSDIAMPQEDGYRLMQRIREREPERGGLVPAVALTAYARAEDTDRSLAAGFQVHLSKPVDLDQLLETVARLSEQRVRS